MSGARTLRGLAAGAVAFAAFAALAACTLEPRYGAPRLPVDDAWPEPAQAAALAGSGAAAAETGWRDFFADQRLQALIALALANNRDLRVAVLNVERARAAYRVQRSALVPEIDAGGAFTREKLPAALSNGAPAAIYQDYEAGLQVPAFEIDLFGRVRSLSHAALEQYLAQSETGRAAQLSLIAAVADAYVTLALDRELRQLAAGTLDSQQASYDLTAQRRTAGSASGLDLAQARTTVESARSDLARYEGNVARDLDALNLLVGTGADASLLPETLDDRVTGLPPPPPGLPSSVLLRRPDVLAAEHQLRAASASIGAARAAFFPSISLVGNIGSASEQLSGLFKAGTGTWTFNPQVNLPIFAGGRNLANLAAATADQRIAVAGYEKAIQAGFRDVADALALSTTLGRQRQAGAALVEATSQAFALARQRYQAGRDSYLNVLDAQRSDYAAKQQLLTVRAAEQSNRIALYAALGGGWRERSAVSAPGPSAAPAR